MTVFNLKEENWTGGMMSGIIRNVVYDEYTFEVYHNSQSLDCKQ